MSIFKNTRIAVKNVFLASVELKIHCMVCAVHLQGLVLPVLSSHIGYLVGARQVLIAPSCSPAIFRKSRQSVSVTANGYKLAAKRVAWGLILPPTLVLGGLGLNTQMPQCISARLLYVLLSHSCTRTDLY